MSDSPRSHHPHPGDIVVVIPCHNDGDTLQATLASVASQTRPPSETLVVDDGSTDPRTRQALLRLRNAGTRVVTQDHRGVAAARNLGLRRSRSPLVVLLDADDLLAPTYLERTAARLDGDSDLHFVTTSYQLFGQVDLVHHPRIATLPEMLARGPTMHISTMFRRTVWEAAGGFDEAMPNWEDWDFWIAAAANGFSGEVIDEPLFHYRVRLGSRFFRGHEGDTFVRSMELLRTKHRGIVESRWSEIVSEKRHHLHQERAREAHLRREQRRLERERQALDNELALLSAELRMLGIEPSTGGG